MADTDHSSSYKNLSYRTLSGSTRRVPSLVSSVHDSSDTGTTRHRLKPIYLLSYRLGPEKNQLFNVGLAQQWDKCWRATSLLRHKKIPNLTKSLSENIKKKLRDEAVRSPHYKLLVFVAIAQNQRPGITFATRCIGLLRLDPDLLGGFICINSNGRCLDYERCWLV